MSQEGANALTKETFLTSLQRAPGSSSASRPGTATSEEPHAMEMVRARHAQLQQVVGSLSEKEQDFLAAYRAHMFNVQKELHELREKLRRNETIENKSEKVKKLEDERDWYRKEALRLDAFTTSMSADLKAMRDKLEAIESDREWLERQLKACKRQNKLLRAEMDTRAAGIDAGGLLLSSFDAKSRAVATPSGEKPLVAHSTAVADELPLLSLDGVVQSPTRAEEKLKKKLRQLKRELQHKTLELAAAKEQPELSRLQSLFLQCVAAVKDDAARRRVGPADAANKVVRPLRGQRGDELDDLTASDRVRLIERLLAHHEVLALLYAQLFPSGEGADATHVADEGGGSKDRPGSGSDGSGSNSDGSGSRATVEPDASRASTPVGSGAAVASAARGAGLALDAFTKDYLRSAGHV